VYDGCPARGDGAVCLSSRRLGRCAEGTLASVTDCEQENARCVDDALGARCVQAACPATGTATVCFGGAFRGTCVDGALTSTVDCAATGQRCLRRGDGAVCGAVPSCPASGTVTQCLDATRLRTCVDGTPGQVGDCADFAAYCSDDVGGAANCVFTLCAAPGTDPIAHETCAVQGGEQMSCSGAGLPTTTPCPAGKACADRVGGAPVCEERVCPASGVLEVCLDTATLALCGNGALFRTERCADRGQFCASEGGTHCADAVCADDEGALGPPRDVCLPDGRTGRCSAAGVVENITSCAAGNVCASVGSGVVACVPPPPVVDAGVDIDAGVDVDAGVDAGVDEVDGGSDDDVDAGPARRVRRLIVTAPSGGGCACSGGAPAETLAAALLLLTLRRRRR
jgi:uncharacterized protein (TIGR03382 family)